MMQENVENDSRMRDCKASEWGSRSACIDASVEVLKLGTADHCGSWAFTQALVPVRRLASRMPLDLPNLPSSMSGLCFRQNTQSKRRQIDDRPRIRSSTPGALLCGCAREGRA